MLRVVAVDDEQPVLNLLKIVLEQVDGVKVEKVFTDSEKALAGIREIKPDAVFLDIEMPEINGLELAGLLIEENPDLMIVFVTGYNRYAVEAFGVNALDYILKPVTYGALEKCISRLNRLAGINNKEISAKYEKKIICLGEFTVIGNNGPIKWATKKVEELLAYFILNRDSDEDGWVIGEALWPEADSGRIKANLHTTLFRLRKTLLEENLPLTIHSVKGGRGIYRCTIENLPWDLSEFEKAIASGEPVSKDNIEKWEQTANLYRGDLFHRRDYRWCEGKRAQLRDRYLRLLLRLAEYYKGEDDHQEEIRLLKVAADQEPFDEEIHRLLLMACHNQKNHALMAKYHHEFISRIRDELDVKPQIETAMFFEKLIEEK